MFLQFNPHSSYKKKQMTTFSFQKNKRPTVQNEQSKTAENEKP